MDAKSTNVNAMTIARLMHRVELRSPLHNEMAPNMSLHCVKMCTCASMLIRETLRTLDSHLQATTYKYNIYIYIYILYMLMYINIYIYIYIHIDLFIYLQI